MGELDTEAPGRADARTRAPRGAATDRSRRPDPMCALGARMRRGCAALATVAALVVATLGGVRFWNTQTVTFAATTDVLALTLPDGSEVTLSPGSEIGYARGFGVRDVSLTGEAFFDVARDAAHPFTVETSEARVTVSGDALLGPHAGACPKPPSWSRKAACAWRPSRRASGAPVVLTPGQRAVVGQTIRSEAADVAAALAWRRAAFAVYDAPLGAVAVQIERAYGTPIRLAAGVDPQERVTALLPLADDAQTVVTDLAAGLGYRAVARAGGFDLYP